MKKICYFFVSIFLLLSSYSNSLAFEKETVPETEVKNDFVLGGGKIEIELEKGQEMTGEISVTNRLGIESEFKVETEDFIGTNNPEDTSVIFLDKEKSPYTLKDSVVPEVRSFSLKHGERIKLPIKVSIPKDAEPGGRYGAILVSVKGRGENVSLEKDKAAPKVQIVSRLASLLYVTVKGDARKDGALQDFKTEKGFYEKGPINFSIISRNIGNIHLKPSGRIEVKNLLNKKVEELPIEDFFVLPGAIKEKKVAWNSGFLCGKYEAKLVLNRNYNDLVDERTIVFWVIPWKLILIFFVLSVFVIFFFQKIFSKFEIRRKK